MHKRIPQKCMLQGPSLNDNKTQCVAIAIWDSEQCSSATLYMSRRTWHAIKAVQWPSFRLCAGHKSRYTSKIVGQTQLLSYIYRTFSTSSYFSICCKFWLKCSTINWHSTKKGTPHVFFLTALHNQAGTKYIYSKYILPLTFVRIPALIPSH